MDGLTDDVRETTWFRWTYIVNDDDDGDDDYQNDDSNNKNIIGDNIIYK